MRGKKPHENLLRPFTILVLTIQKRANLDFCHKYHLDKSAKQSLSDFTKKLREKRQNAQQQRQAAHAISIFYEIGRFKTNKKISLREKTGVSRTKKEHLKRTGADWKPVYDNLYAEIKIVGMHFTQPTTKCRCRASRVTELLLYI